MQAQKLWQPQGQGGDKGHHQHYWQGDEAKFQEAAAGEPLYLSPIRYDASTQRFQVIASTPIRARSTGAFEGILVIGLDVEEALSRVD